MNIIISIFAGIVLVVSSLFVPDIIDNFSDEPIDNAVDNLGATSFPSSIDTLTNPTATDKTNSPSHSTQHANANDALEAIQTKLGADGSAVTTTHTYKLSGVTGSDKASSLAGNETLTNKTLTSPNITGMTATSSTLIGTTLNATTTIASTTITKFTANSGTSTNLYVTTLGVGSDYITDITGTNLSITNGVLSVSSAAATAETLVPLPQGNAATVVATPTLTGSTTAFLGQIIVPFSITVNKISFAVGGVTVAGTIDITLYSEDGQTQIFSTTTNSISTTGVKTVGLSAVSLSPGVYYIMVNTNSTTNIVPYAWGQSNEPFTTTNGLLGDVTSEPVVRGTLAISADTPPATFTPSSITDATESTLIIRLDE